MVSQASLLEAVQLHPGSAVTLAEPLLCDAGCEALVGVIEKLAHPVPDCVTVKVCAAIVMVPVRWLAEVFWPTE
jgi:hypothetical protein